MEDGSGLSRPGSGDGSGDGLQDGSGDGLQDGSGDGARPSRPVAFRLRSGHGKSVPQLVPHVLAMIAEHGREDVSRDRVKADLHVGSKAAGDALRLALAKIDDDPAYWADQAGVATLRAVGG
jgi:hypothetical protein